MENFSMYMIVMVYFLAIAFLGFLGYKKTKNSKDFLIGGGEMNPIVMSLSYGATFISASAIVGFGGVAATFGMGIQWLMFLNMFVGVVIAFIIFGRRHGASVPNCTPHRLLTSLALTTTQRESGCLLQQSSSFVCRSTPQPFFVAVCSVCRKFSASVSTFRC